MSLAFYIISTLCITDLFGFVCRLCITCIFHFNIKRHKKHISLNSHYITPCYMFSCSISQNNHNKINKSEIQLPNSPFSNMHIFATLLRGRGETSSLATRIKHTQYIAFRVFRARLHGWFYGRNQRQDELLCDIPM